MNTVSLSPSSVPPRAGGSPCSKRGNLGYRSLLRSRLLRNWRRWQRQTISQSGAKRGSRDKLLAVLAKAPDVEPEEYDKL